MTNKFSAERSIYKIDRVMLFIWNLMSNNIVQNNINRMIKKKIRDTCWF